MTTLLLGPPASGKGTIGRMISRELNLPLVSVGKLLREIPKSSIWHAPIQEAMDKGELAPNSILGGFLAEVTKDSRYENGYILDGWVRQLTDLSYFDPEPDFVILLNISLETSQKRVLSRRVCRKGSHTYNLISNPPKKEGICDIDGSELISRDDDNIEVLEHRWEVYKENTLEVIDHYRSLGKLKEISAEGTPKSIFISIMEELNT